MKWTLSILVVLTMLAVQLNDRMAGAGQSRDPGFGAGNEYDRTKKVTIEGVITKLEMGMDRRSSSQIGVNVKNQNGRITNWTVAGPSQIQLESSGLGELLKIGERVKVTGAPLKENQKSSTAADWFGKERMYGTTFTVAGREFSQP